MSVHVIVCADCRCLIEGGRTYRWLGTQQGASQLVLHAFELWPGYDAAEFSECAWQRLLPDFPSAMPLVY